MRRFLPFLRRRAYLLHWPYVRWQVVRPAWFVILVVVLLAAVLLDPQTGDVFAAAAGDPLRTCLLFAGLGLFALTAWYVARTALYVDYGLFARSRRFRWAPPVEPEDAPFWRRWLPRLLGLALPLVVARVFWRNGALWLAVSALLLGAGFLAFVLLRHRLVPGGAEPRPMRFARPVPRLPKVSFKLLLYLFLGACALFLVVLLAGFFDWGAGLLVWLGSPFLLFMAGAFWIGFGTYCLVYPTYRFRLVPLAAVVLLVAVAFNWLPWRAADHRVRAVTMDAAAPEAVAFGRWAEDRPDVAAHFRTWLKDRAPAVAAGTDADPYPVFVAAAEGGGIRAAYWTAASLSAIEDRVPGFSCHVFAISGVSGGSLGAAVYAGLVADRARAGRLDCGRPAGRGAGSGLLPRATRTLEHDFLAPVLAGMLFPDLVQRFLPVSLLPDRNAYLERAWEGAWTGDGQAKPCPGATDGGGCNWLKAPFQALWRDTGTRVPSLFLNATEVETGRRLIVANLRLRPDQWTDDPTPDRRAFNEATDAFAPDARPGLPSQEPQLAWPIRLSTAAALSARFTYVSPPGRLHNGVRAVDGGYFENGGVVTAADVLRRIEGIGPRAGKLRFVVLNLVNSTFEEDDEERVTPPGPLARGLHETAAPLDALLSSRVAHGRLARDDLRAALPSDAEMDRLGLGRPGRRLAADCAAEGKTDVRAFPLGWMLAGTTVDEMAAQARDAVAASLGKGGWLGRLLKARPGCGGQGPEVVAGGLGR